MATFRLLEARYEGKLGKTTGVFVKGRAIVKASITAKAKPTVKQRSSRLVFEKLNRVGVGFAKSFWSVLGLSDKTMLRHNACVQALSGLIADGTFQPLNFTDIIRQIDGFIMSPPAQQAPNQPITVSFINSSFIPPFENPQIHLIAIDNEGHSGIGLSAPFGFGPFFLAAPQDQIGNGYVLAFLSATLKGKKYLFCGNAEKIDSMQYSLDEQLTGDFWIDGRPIYQKTWNNLDISAKGSINFPHNISNLDMPLSVKGFCKITTDPIVFNALPDPSTQLLTNQIDFQVTQTVIRIIKGETSSSTLATLTLQYIKSS